MMLAPRRRRATAAIGAAVALVLSAWPPAAPTSPTAGLELRLTSITPAVADRGSKVEVSGTVRNPGATAIPAPTVILRGSATGLTRRSEIAAWAAGSTAGVDATIWDEDSLSGNVEAGQTRTFRLRTRLAPHSAASYAALPLAVDAAGARVSTFLPQSGPGDFPPLDTVLVLPVTLRAHRALFGEYGATRLAAWLSEIGPEGRLTRLLATGIERRAAWAVDPTLLAAPAAIPAERPIDPEAGAAWDRIGPQQRAEAAARRTFRAALIDAVSDQDCFVLPMADADLVAGLTVPAAQPLLRLLVRDGIAAGAEGLPHCSTTLLWPADGILSSARVSELAAYLPDGHADAVLGRASSTPGGATASSSPWRSTSGTPAVAYDDALSAAFLELPSDPAGVVTGQRLLADSLALFLQAPATRRELTLAVPRGVAFSGTGLDAALDRLEQAPWLRAAALDDTIAAARTGPPLADATPRDVPEPADLPRDPVALSPPAITANRLRALERALDQVTTTAKVRADGPEQVRLWNAALAQLLSCRWRGDNSQFQGQMRRLRTAGAEASTGVQVTPETINFFADTGRLQLTVTNDLGVGLTNLQVDLTPLSGWLRLDDQPRAVDVGAHSKAVVTVHATALAAGSVPIRARLSAPDGSAVGPDTTVLIRVRPTGDWIYWAMGGLAAVLMTLGAWRSRRHPNRPRLAR
ncbi:MAG: DUF6049 family protein [Tetrasphaera sp.]